MVVMTGYATWKREMRKTFKILLKLLKEVEHNEHPGLDLRTILKSVFEKSGMEVWIRIGSSLTG
jgi:hypothetical protein